MNTVVGSNRLRSRAAASPDADETSGGNVDENSKRLGQVEISMAEVRTLSRQAATKTDLAEVRVELKDEIHSVELKLKDEIRSVSTSVEALRTEVHATRSELKSDMNLLRADMHALEARMIRWIVGTTISVAALAFSIAKFVH